MRPMLASCSNTTCDRQRICRQEEKESWEEWEFPQANELSNGFEPLNVFCKIEVSQKQGEEHGVNLVCAQQGEQHQK